MGLKEADGYSINESKRGKETDHCVFCEINRGTSRASKITETDLSFGIISLEGLYDEKLVY
jgi:hypothetical protein